MPHIPSFLIGSLASGTVFLAVHQQLSHRRRLSEKWALQEMAEEQFRSLISKISTSREKSTKQLTGTSKLPSIEKTWNYAVSTLQDLAGKQP